MLFNVGPAEYIGTSLSFTGRNASAATLFKGFAG